MKTNTILPTQQIIIQTQLHKHNHTNKHNCKHKSHTLLVVNFNTEHLWNCGIIFYRTELLRKLCTRDAITSFYHR